MNEVQGWLRQYVHAPAFIERYPHYAAVLSRFDAFHDSHVYAMAVSKHGRRYYLHVNVDYFVEHPEFLHGILLHEVHHVVLGHLDLDKFRGSASPRIMELAMEVSANEFIREPLPEAAVTIETLPGFGLRPMQSTLERYELLAYADREVPFFCDAHAVDDHDPRGGDGLRAATRGGGALIGGLWDLLESLSEASDRPGLIAGRQPGRLRENLVRDQRREPAKIDWRRELERFVSCARTSGHSYRRPNRRFPERVGEIPGRSWSQRDDRNPRLLVAIDTSSSMEAHELTAIARQLERMRPHAKITIAECDTEITRIYPFEGELTCVVGRGGTDLRPPFAAEVLAEHAPDGVVYFTDGQGPHPPFDPGVRTLWVLTKSEEFGCAWGDRVTLAA